MLPNAVMMMVNRKNWGGGWHIKVTEYPNTAPSAVLTTTFTGMNHQRIKFLRLIDETRWLSIKQGKKRTNTSLLRILKVSFGTNWNFGWAISEPITAMERSFSNGNTALTASAPPESMLLCNSEPGKGSIDQQVECLIEVKRLRNWVRKRRKWLI